MTRPSRPLWSLRRLSPRCRRIPKASSTNLLLLTIPSLGHGLMVKWPRVAGSDNQRQWLKPKQGLQFQLRARFQPQFQTGSQRHPRLCAHPWERPPFPSVKTNGLASSPLLHLHLHYLLTSGIQHCFLMSKLEEVSENKRKQNGFSSCLKLIDKTGGFQQTLDMC